MRKIKVKHYRVLIPPRFGRPQRPIRIAVIADLHNRLFGEGNNELVETVQQQYPDLIFSLGDLTVCRRGKEADISVGAALLKRLACDCPVYCVNGNHEYRAKVYPASYPGVYARLSGELKNAGITLLENAKAQIDLAGTRLTLYGLELPLKYYRKWSKEFVTADQIRGRIHSPDKDRYNILLAHSPVYFESYALWGANLTLSGHLHGGTVRLPLLGGVISPQMKLFPRYAYGMFEKYGRRMIVTSGLGTHSCAMRINNPPEVVVLNLA